MLKAATRLQLSANSRVSNVLRTCRHTAASRNTAACAAFSFGVHENRYCKPSYSYGKSEDSEKAFEAYDEIMWKQQNGYNWRRKTQFSTYARSCGSTAASMNPAACAAISFGVHEHRYWKPSLSGSINEDPEKVFEAYDEILKENGYNCFRKTGFSKYAISFRFAALQSLYWCRSEQGLD